MIQNIKPLLLLPIIFCLVFAACKDPDDTEGTIANPKVMVLQIDLGTMTDPNSVWQNLLFYIEGQGKYIALDLSACTMNGTEFNPDYTIATGKDKIVSIVLPDTATSIASALSSDKAAFIWFYNLKSFTGKNLITIGDWAFRTTNLCMSSLPEKLISIGVGAFELCTNFVLTSLPESITSIGNNAFEHCTNLALTSLPAGITTIGDNVFECCTNLALTSLPAGITSIGDRAFYGCTNLALISLPPALAFIGNSAFYNCVSLSQITLSEGLTSIGSSAFNDCTNLAQITMPAKVIILGKVNFVNCKNIVFTLTGSGSLSVIDNGRALVRNNTELLAYPSASGIITLPENITFISDLTFYNCTDLKKINLPAGIKSVAPAVFDNCTSLSEITLPEGITFIGANAFYRCSSLTQITLPASLTFIDNFAFMDCPNLSLVTSLATTPPELDYIKAFMRENLQQIKVPADSVDAYKAALYWSEYADIITAIE